MADEEAATTQDETAEDTEETTTDHSPDAAQMGTSDGDGESS